MDAAVLTGPEHYREAERLLSNASFTSLSGRPVTRDGRPMSADEHAVLVARAQAHATLALAATQASRLADPYIGDGDHINDWRAATGVARTPNGDGQ
jgi:hypothetical protein